ncbi:hypothetical protein Tco_0128897 [Tanacetum coccineum]
MKELQQLQVRLKEIKEKCNKNIQRIKKAVENINTGDIIWNRRAFQEIFVEEFKSFKEGFVCVMDRLEILLDKEEAFSSLFGEDVEYFAPRLFFNMGKLEKQLNEEEFNEEIAMVVFKAFKQDEDKYVNNIIQLEAKNKDLEHTFCKMSKSGQTLRMLTNEQSLYLKNKRKIALGYTDPYPLGQAIACHPKLCDAKVLGLHYVKPDVHDTRKFLMMQKRVKSK